MTGAISYVYTGPTVVDCSATGITSSGYSGAGTTEEFGMAYESIDWIKMSVAASVTVKKSDRVRNIRNSAGVIWKEEDIAGTPDTIFEVLGVIPILDAFGRHIENSVLLERADVQ